MIFKETLCVFAIFLAFKANDLDQVSDWVNAREGIERELNLVDFDFPWADAIDMDFGPREDWGLSRREVSLWSGGGANLRADFAVGDNALAGFANFGATEVSFHEGFEAIHSCTVQSCLMMPFDEWMNHGIR